MLLYDMNGVTRLRPARMSDAINALRWRNEETTRNASRDNRIISTPEHLVWWRESLEDPLRRLYIITQGVHDMGVVWLKRHEQYTSISVYVTCRAHGRGIGSRAIALACSTLPPTERVLAEIKENNKASQKAFEKAGFQEVV